MIEYLLLKWEVVYNYFFRCLVVFRFLCSLYGFGSVSTSVKFDL